jgi:acyl carrier protein
MAEDVFSKMADLIVRKGIPREKITLDSSFEELGMDSLDAVELIADLEEAFNVNIPNTELQNFKTIRQAVDSLERVAAK